MSSLIELRAIGKTAPRGGCRSPRGISYRRVPVRPDNIAEFRRSIGFLPQEFNAYACLTAARVRV